MLDAVAGRYARALAEVVGIEDAAALGKTSGEVDLMSRVLGGEPELRIWFDDPTVAHEQKIAALKSFASAARQSDTAQRFLAVVVTHRRVGTLPAIAYALREIKDRAAGILPAETTVAAKLSDAETAAFKGALETMTGRSVRLSVTVDPAVLGGAVTRIGSRIYDGSIRTRLEALHRRLAAAR